MAINWALLNNNSFENALARGMEMGKIAGEARDKRQYQNALNTVMMPQESTVPDSPANAPDFKKRRAEAMRVIAARNPGFAMKLMERADEQEFNTAMGEYLTPNGQPNALLGLPSHHSGINPAANAQWGSNPQPEAMPPAQMPGVQMQGAVQPSGATQMPGALQPSDTQQGPAPVPDSLPPQAQRAPDMAFLGEPRSGQDRAFLAMLQRNPEKALKIQSALRDNFMDRLEAESDFYGLAVSALTRTSDDAGWQVAMQQLAPRAQAMGVDLMATIPAQYPGPEAVGQLLERALPIKERLDYLLDVANTKADNERADRNTDSLIEDREGRRAETRRYNERRIDTTRRGQDKTDARVRSGQGSKRTSRGKARPTATDAKGNKVEWNGKAWVPVG
ncbi:hypothetical protein EKN06_12345 [Croceicoccus ponticola]|uniref:Uncharacterized protein n=1 Tax=Croceicoccus ponticola TaxID=2217664 RepID=A0A437GVR9_9SPHN|nr:hypothetical protein [Croceicoccus ponticola]RVQ65718.1 hypothetical protein EKN06_12345 [Croceicoccus ponticola]